MSGQPQTSPLQAIVEQHQRLVEVSTAHFGPPLGIADTNARQEVEQAMALNYSLSLTLFGSYLKRKVRFNRSPYVTVEAQSAVVVAGTRELYVLFSLNQGEVMGGADEISGSYVHALAVFSGSGQEKSAHFYLLPFRKTTQ